MRHWPGPAGFALAMEQQAGETRESRPDLGFALDREIDEIYGLAGSEARRDGRRWGGFLRRGVAFSIDVFVLFLLSLFLFYVSYVGYGVGLAFHHRTVSLANLGEISSILALAWVCLIGGYFVLLHGMEGKTVGKWLLGLRVVGVRDGGITYRQAFVRWLAAMSLAPLALGFLWILLSREKRAWHDCLAGTWVVQE